MNKGSLTLEKLESVVNKVSYKDWELRVYEISEGFILQWRFWETDNTNPDDKNLYLQGCRKWYISSWATDSEIINTAYLAAQQATIHEFMEQFKYEGHILRDPHKSATAHLNFNIPNDTRQNLEMSAK